MADRQLRVPFLLCGPSNPPVLSARLALFVNLFLVLIELALIFIFGSMNYWVLFGGIGIYIFICVLLIYCTTTNLVYEISGCQYFWGIFNIAYSLIITMSLWYTYMLYKPCKNFGYMRCDLNPSGPVFATYVAIYVINIVDSVFYILAISKVKEEKIFRYTADLDFQFRISGGEIFFASQFRLGKDTLYQLSYQH
eukprot:TRINITY_DN11519_c0_g1_i2.p2 TRINITY_DN11519_c0_g1~~TRINITY_DN11519_c0_g1_i2.p2  ORF type:complete len:195 (-),score=25.61 TRINITY_DN11519_c0_g1_i2:183-767(-)